MMIRKDDLNHSLKPWEFTKVTGLLRFYECEHYSLGPNDALGRVPELNICDATTDWREA